MSSASLKAACLSPTPRTPKVLSGVRVLSLALNLPGPAALMRLQAMGARCTKLEPPSLVGSEPPASGDPMAQYQPKAYQTMHQGVKVLQADLKSAQGQAVLKRLLRNTDVLITSFRPSALDKLGLAWPVLHRDHPQLSCVAIVGAPGVRAEEPGHDLTYVAEQGLVDGLQLPASLFADMGGSLMTTEAVLQTLLLRAQPGRNQGKGVLLEVALSEAAAYLALPRHWGLTTPKGAVGGAHAGYQIYPCKDGRVAVAALEPHFAQRLLTAVGMTRLSKQTPLSPEAHEAVAKFLATQSRQQLKRLAVAKDIPLHTLPR
ncbi:MAG: CoA transferase [Betaproteobacteria bacterium]|nr:CoA transferase [Betaproteobacteria bacterium]